MSTVLRAARRLRRAAAEGELEALCRRHDVSLLVLFGSARTEHPTARDVDIAVRFDPYRPESVLPLAEAVAELADSSVVDLMVLNTAGPVAREQALVFGEALYMSEPDLFAEAQIAAVMERLDTDHLRRQELELLQSIDG
ncbi:MAG TPA: nucleotidyltransferase domain-containing protein [Actinomycetales bacterium]|nr:nucleotidyltransferase domain-containing protein [Actinomycetales bacterium]